MSHATRARQLSLGLCGIVVVSGCAAPPRSADPLDALMHVRAARSARVSSAGPGVTNRDNLWIAPGEVRVLADIEGPAVIRHIWLTFSEAAPNWLSKDGSADPSEIVLRMYWDHADEPAVEAPLGDFFAAGFGRRAEVNSIPVQVQEGDAYNCYWPMPFRTHGRITLTNESPRRVSAFYYHVDFTREAALPADTAYFCAQYRQEFPETPGRDYLILDAEGHGQVVGVVLAARSRSPQWFGEGDEKAYIDGETEPGIIGTGTEDFVLSAWGLARCTFPCFGVPFVDGTIDDPGFRVCAYRWFLHDPICFTKSIRLVIEHAGWMSADETATGKIEGFVEREDDLATTVFWYQTGRPKRFATLPPARERVPPNLDWITDGAALLPTLKHSPGAARLQEGYEWTGRGQVFFVPEKEEEPAGKFVEFRFDVDKEEYRRFVVRLTHSYDYGRYQLFLDNAKVGEPLDLYSPQIEVRDHHVGDYTLSKGAHTLRFECVGRNAASAGTRIGVDSVRLRERWGKKRPSLEPKR